MIYLRRIIRCSRAYHFHLPAAWCRQHQVTPGTSILIQAEIEGQQPTWPTRTVRCGRGLHVPIPREYRKEQGLTWGDPLLLLEEEPGVLTLRVIEGLSEKELSRLGQVVALLRIQQARAEAQRQVDGAYAQGVFTGVCWHLGQVLRGKLPTSVHGIPLVPLDAWPIPAPDPPRTPGPAPPEEP